ncbi:ER lumen protein retaining receptor-domain-containing protein [Gamsiella multidivaricata]|uniref:ER lumen protein retaining receptor-domain-containing protein n=1 Tax=Gamsiella multidivaricata TaxID=101098 RepID=UPI00221F7F8C|nr:ER lumen protein retaining receptor-domain-containing protein [Gamsiella multidivaricata]KAG0362665.1 endoplasmic reticulum retention protein [Gamsiella multidivaricata]KAI7831157.1 ER lumen protein retaining receptor-domain-containing protein [Gamsiella multidivaricata]
MNLFRLVADLMHLTSIFILLLKMQKTRSVAGISFKTQALYAAVFLTRYTDLFTNYVSIYNTSMKIFFISSSLYIVYLMKYKFKATNDPHQDNFRVEYILAGAGVLSLITNYAFTVQEILWTFSVYLEAVAILPQLFMLTKTGEAKMITTHYLFALGAYRGLYLINWIYRYRAEYYVDWIVWIAGAVQTGLYCDFFFIYFTKVLKGVKFELPQ